jgi:hypothetical protein
MPKSPLFDPARVPPDVVSSEGVRQVNAMIERLRGRLVDRLQIAEPGTGFRLSNMIRSYTQAHLRRSLQYIEGAEEEVFASRGLVAISCVRSIFENVAAYYDFEQKLMPLLQEGNIKKIHEFVRARAFATRKPEYLDFTQNPAVQATNILTQIAKMNPLRASYTRDYEHLCEMAHPNSLGAVIYFQRLGQENDIATFHSEGPAPEDDLKWVLVGAFMLSYFEEAIQRVEDALPALSAKGAAEKPAQPPPDKSEG